MRYNVNGDKMIKKINDVNINYITYGNEKGEDVVFLHGWGQNIQMMRPLGDLLARDYHITILDLPGFGESDEPKYAWTVYEYAECVKQLLSSLGIRKPILVGHSFGGKISLLYASMYDTNKLVLLAPTYKKEVTKLSFKTKVLKSLKKVPVLNHLEGFAKKHIGSTDYRNASPIMREILTRHVNTDISEECKKIMCPSLIIWGTNDEAVPYVRAHQLEDLIRNAGVVTYEGCTHYAYLERLHQTVNVLYSFFGSKGE